MVFLRGTLSGHYLSNQKFDNVQGIRHPRHRGLFIFAVQDGLATKMVGAELGSMDLIGEEWSGPKMVGDHYRVHEELIDLDREETLITAWDTGQRKGNPGRYTIYNLASDVHLEELLLVNVRINSVSGEHVSDLCTSLPSTVTSLKQRLQEICGIPAREQVLISEGDVVSNEKKISDVSHDTPLTLVRREIRVEGTLSGAYLSGKRVDNIKAVPHPRRAGLFIFPVHDGTCTKMVGAHVDTVDLIGATWSGPRMFGDHYRTHAGLIDPTDDDNLIAAWDNAPKMGYPNTYTVYHLHSNEPLKSLPGLGTAW